MSDSQKQSYQPTKPAQKNAVWLWFIALLVAAAALAGAVAYAGGSQSVAKILGLGDIRLPSISGLHLPSFGNSSSGNSSSGNSSSGNSASDQPGESQTAVTTATAITTATVPSTSKHASSTLPPSVLSWMYSTQVQSRPELGDLVTWRIGSFTFGVAKTGDDSATIPVTATYARSARRSGYVTLVKYSGTWYLFGFGSSSDKGAADVQRTPQTVDPGVVETIAEQQAQPGTQSMIVNGLLGGGYTQALVTGVHQGPRTATVDVALYGGSLPASKGRFVLVSKDDLGTKYWFVARFEKR